LIAIRNIQLRPLQRLCYNSKKEKKCFFLEMVLPLNF
jgi:hypothetical protein